MKRDVKYKYLYILNIQIAKKEIPNTEVRNVFIEGPIEKYEAARSMIENIVVEVNKFSNFLATEN